MGQKQPNWQLPNFGYFFPPKRINSSVSTSCILHLYTICITNFCAKHNQKKYKKKKSEESRLVNFLHLDPLPSPQLVHHFMGEAVFLVA